VILAAAKIVLEPIFEADFLPTVGRVVTRMVKMSPAIGHGRLVTTGRPAMGSESAEARSAIDVSHLRKTYGTKVAVALPGPPEARDMGRRRLGVRRRTS
jgi:hypothetical protein